MFQYAALPDRNARMHVPVAHRLDDRAFVICPVLIVADEDQSLFGVRQPPGVFRQVEARHIRHVVAVALEEAEVAQIVAFEVVEDVHRAAIVPVGALERHEMPEAAARLIALVGPLLRRIQTRASIGVVRLPAELGHHGDELGGPRVSDHERVIPDEPRLVGHLDEVDAAHPIVPDADLHRLAPRTHDRPRKWGRAGGLRVRGHRVLREHDMSAAAIVPPQPIHRDRDRAARRVNVDGEPVAQSGRIRARPQRQLRLGSPPGHGHEPGGVTRLGIGPLDRHPRRKIERRRAVTATCQTSQACVR